MRASDFGVATGCGIILSNMKKELVQDFKFESPEQARLAIFKYKET